MVVCIARVLRSSEEIGDTAEAALVLAVADEAAGAAKEKQAV